MRPVGTMRELMTYALAGACAAWMLHACSSSGDEQGAQAAVCTPNLVLACECPGRRPSTATCLADGSGVTPCACTAALDGGSTPGATGGSGNDAGGGWTGVIGGGATDAGESDATAMPSAPSDSGPTAADGSAGFAGPAVPSAGCGASSTVPSGSMTIDVDGVQRQYIVRAPGEYDPNRPHRLVFAWHGLGGTAMQIASTFYGLATRSANSAVFIAAQALPGTGQQAGLASWSNKGDSDITFTRKLLEWAKANYCIDEKRVFSIGMSNGGMMSNIVGCELGDAFRAIAAMSGGGPRGYAMKPCTGQIAAWISHGNRDNNVPFSYGEMSRDYWKSENHCGGETLPAMPGSCLEYQGCDPGFPVQFCEFDGGHMVPSFTGEAAWTFFERF